MMRVHSLRITQQRTTLTETPILMMCKCFVERTQRYVFLNACVSCLTMSPGGWLYSPSNSSLLTPSLSCSQWASQSIEKRNRASRDLISSVVVLHSWFTISISTHMASQPNEDHATLNGFCCGQGPRCRPVWAASTILTLLF